MLSCILNTSFNLWQYQLVPTCANLCQLVPTCNNLCRLVTIYADCRQHILGLLLNHINSALRFPVLVNWYTLLVVAPLLTIQFFSSIFLRSFRMLPAEVLNFVATLSISTVCRRCSSTGVTDLFDFLLSYHVRSTSFKLLWFLKSVFATFLKLAKYIKTVCFQQGYFIHLG